MYASTSLLLVVLQKVIWLQKYPISNVVNTYSLVSLIGEFRSCNCAGNILTYNFVHLVIFKTFSKQHDIEYHWGCYFCCIHYSFCVYYLFNLLLSMLYDDNQSHSSRKYRGNGTGTYSHSIEYQNWKCRRNKRFIEKLHVGGTHKTSNSNFTLM